MIKLGKAIGLAMGLAACSAAQTTQLETYSKDLSTILADVNQNIYLAAKNDLPTACAIANSLDADFKIAAQISAKVAAQSATEAVVMVGVAAVCGATPPTDIVSAVATVIGAGIQVQAALKPIAGTAAAAPGA